MVRRRPRRSESPRPPPERDPLLPPWATEEGLGQARTMVGRGGVRRAQNRGRSCAGGTPDPRACREASGRSNRAGVRVRGSLRTLVVGRPNADPLKGRGGRGGRKAEVFLVRCGGGGPHSTEGGRTWEGVMRSNADFRTRDLDLWAVLVAT